VRVPRQREAMHFLVHGADYRATEQERAIRQILAQIWERGETPSSTTRRWSTCRSFYSPARAT